MKYRILSMFLVSLLFCTAVTASSINGDYKGNPIVKVKANGKELTVEDVPAMINDGRTMVPIYLLKQLGYDVTWDPQTYTVDMKPSATMSKENRKKLTKKDLQSWTDRVGYLVSYKTDNIPYMQGTAFVISQDGLMITNHHVTDGGSRYEFDLNGTAYRFSSSSFDNAKTDLFGFVLNDKLPYLSYSTALPQIGDVVYALGYPQGHFTVTDGLVNDIYEKNGIKYISHSAFIDHGSSGGVLLNEYGDVIGVTNSSVDGTNIGSAIPMMYVQQEIDNLKK